MDTVYWTAAYTAHAALNRWLASATTPQEAVGEEGANGGKSRNHRTRHIIFTSSTLAFTPVAGYAPYSPAKAAMRSLADTLNMEVEAYNGARRRGGQAAAAADADIKVHIVFPMGILSPGYENEQRTKPALTKKLEESDKPQPPEE
ncbi:3-dehydrosphinganine reductase, partial [Ascosphaera acerosa]